MKLQASLYLVRLSLLIILFLAPQTVQAQESDRDVDVAKRGTESAKQAAKISKQASSRQVPEIGRINFDDIRARPDDVILNFNFAKQQVAENDMLGASVTLERILIVDPSLDPVRMFYAVVLYRLDNLVEAERELNTLSKKELPGDIRSELKRYQKEIKKRKKRTHFALGQSVGFGHDSNRNAVPSSKKRLFGNGLTDIAPADRSRRDTSFLNVTSVDIVHDLPFQAGHQLIGNFTYFLQEQTYLDSLDLSSFSYDLGAVYKIKGFNITPLFRAGHVLLSRETFLRTKGGRISVDRDFLNGRLNVFNTHTLDYQDYTNITENQASFQRRGNQYDLKQGATLALNRSMSLTTAIGYTHKEAKYDIHAYDRISLETDHVWIWPKGQFLINSLTGAFDEYDEPDLALASRERHDRTLRYRFTYGAPIGTLLFPIKKILPGQIKEVTFTFTYEYFRDLSNYTNYTYHNNLLQVMLSKKWEF